VVILVLCGGCAEGDYDTGPNYRVCHQGEGAADGCVEPIERSDT
jgi:hypothetical protein